MLNLAHTQHNNSNTIQHELRDELEKINKKQNNNHSESVSSQGSLMSHSSLYGIQSYASKNSQYSIK